MRRIYSSHPSDEARVLCGFLFNLTGLEYSRFAIFRWLIDWIVCHSKSLALSSCYRWNGLVTGLDSLGSFRRGSFRDLLCGNE